VANAGLPIILRRAAGFAAVMILPACSGDAPRGRETVVDSAPSAETLLARFRTGLAEPEAFTGGASSRDALVAAFVRAVEQRDTVAFGDLALTREEFAWLYYPLIPEAAPPYELEPTLMWFMVKTNSGRGLRTLLEERGGQPLGFLDYRCDGERRHGPLTVWGPCAVRRLHAPRDTVTEILFGPIVERNGRWKFVSYANKL